MTESHRRAAPAPSANVETAFFETEAVLYDDRTGMIHRLNPTASAVWLALDGIANRADIVNELANLLGVSPADLQDGVDAALEDFERLGVLTGSEVDPGPAPDIANDAVGEHGASVTVLAIPPDP